MGPKGPTTCLDLNLSRPRRAHLLLQKCPSTSPDPHLSSTHSPSHPPNPEGTGSMKGKWWEAPSLCPCLAVSCCWPGL